MSYDNLKYRKRFATSVNTTVLNGFYELAKKLRINKSNLVDEALIDLMQKYDIDTTEMEKDVEENSRY